MIFDSDCDYWWSSIPIVIIDDLQFQLWSLMIFDSDWWSNWWSSILIVIIDDLQFWLWSLMIFDSNCDHWWSSILIVIIDDFWYQFWMIFDCECDRGWSLIASLIVIDLWFQVWWLSIMIINQIPFIDYPWLKGNYPLSSRKNHWTLWGMIISWRSHEWSFVTCLSIIILGSLSILPSVCPLVCRQSLMSIDK